MKEIKVIGMEEERKLLSEAFDNGYRECEGRDLYITFFVDDGPLEDDMIDMMLWYEEEEWYERCAVIKEYIDKKF